MQKQSPRSDKKRKRGETNEKAGGFLVVFPGFADARLTAT